MTKTLTLLALAAALAVPASAKQQAPAAAAKMSLSAKRAERAALKAQKIKPARLQKAIELQNARAAKAKASGKAAKSVDWYDYANVGWGLDGSWYNENFDGEGWFVQYITNTNRVWAAFFTYTDLGEKEWYVGEGPIVGDTAELDVYRPAGKRHMTPTIETPLYKANFAGYAWITLDYCDQAYFEWDLSYDPEAPSTPIDWLETVKLTAPKDINGFDLCSEDISWIK